MTTEPEWTTINDAAHRTGKSKRTIWRLLATWPIDTATQQGMTLVHLPQLRRAISKTKRGPASWKPSTSDTPTQ